jgi:hypothetical protein
MTFPAILGLIAIGYGIAAIGVRIWRWIGSGSQSVPRNGSSKTPSAVDPPSPALSSLRPAASLKKLQKRVGNSLPAELAKSLQERIDDLILALTEAHSVLSAGAAEALNLSARKIVHCHWITGREWRKYLANFGAAANVGRQIDEAWENDACPLVSEIARLLALRPPAALVRMDEGYGLACAACGENAVTFRKEKGSVQANNISNVNRNLYWSGEKAQRLIELLEQGSVQTVLDYLASPSGGGCPAFCPECARVYCREHYSVEEVWSGSWHEASYATCPLGHEREFE